MTIKAINQNRERALFEQRQLETLAHIRKALEHLEGAKAHLEATRQQH